jgi:hypothetical protein
MRAVLIATVLLGVFASSAPGQTSRRVEIGTVARSDWLFVEAGGTGRSSVAGVVAGWQFSPRFGLEGEMTAAAGGVMRSYEGWFISYAPPNATREEIERLAPIARRTLRYDPGGGGAMAFVVRQDLSPRAAVRGRIGLSGRRYLETSTYDVLQIPDGVDPARVARDFGSESGRHSRGGLMLGLSLSVRATSRLQLEPEVRYVYGGPAQVGRKHREVSAGIRGVWAV